MYVYTYVLMCVLVLYVYRVCMYVCIVSLYMCLFVGVGVYMCFCMCVCVHVRAPGLHTWAGEGLQGHSCFGSTCHRVFCVPPQRSYLYIIVSVALFLQRSFPPSGRR